MKNKSKVVGVDLLIGQRIRQRRVDVKMSQTQLGNYLGVSFQQVQKYENGKNRVSASTLFRISEILCVDLNYFVSGLNESKILCDSSCTPYRTDPKTVNMLSNFSSIKDSSLRDHIVWLVRKITDLSKEK